ncbi:unnamed protein product [Caenorhabditis brenneri]
MSHPDGPPPAKISKILDLSPTIPDPVLKKVLEAPPPIKLPNLLYKADHPYVKHQQGIPASAPDAPSTVAIRISTETTLKTLQDFRNQSIRWMREPVEKMPTTHGVVHENMKAIIEKPDAIHAIYILKSMDGRIATLVAHHQELVANDRPDLYMVHLNCFSNDILNPGAVEVNNYMIGDAFCVMSLHPHPNPPSFLTTFDKIQDPRSHRFWDVSDFYLIKREYTQDHLVTRISTPDKHQKQFFVVEGSAELHKIRNRKSGLNTRPDQVYLGRKFVPQLKSGEPCTSVKGKLPLTTFPSTITEVAALPDGLLAQMDFETLLRTVRFGVCGVDAMINRVLDPEFYVSEARAVILTPTGRDFKLNISSPNGPANPKNWKEGTKFFIKNSMGTMEFRVEQEPERTPKCLVLTGRPLNPKYDIDQVLTDGNLLVFQKLHMGQQHFSKYFPTTAPPPDSPLRSCLASIFGVAQFPMPSNLESWDTRFGAIEFSKEQTEFVNTWVHSSIPAIQVDSCFRTGKTLMGVIGANLLTGVNILTATEEHAVEKLVKVHLSLARDVRARAVRLGSNPRNPTSLDFSSLWPQALLSKIQEINESEVLFFDQILVQSAIRHLIDDTTKDQKRIRHYRFRRRDLQEKFKEIQKARPPAKLNVLETFLLIFKPKILFGTVEYFTEALCGDLKNLRDEIQTVTFDNANVLPYHQFFAIGAYCSRARFAFLGDSQQPGPYVEKGLPKVLKGFAYGDFFLKKKLPCFEFPEVYNCPARLVSACSSLFYGGTLKFTAFSVNCAKAQKLGAHFGSQIPIQAVKLDQEADEPKIVTGLIEQLRRKIPGISIGILSFSPHQLPKNSIPRDVFIGTIDEIKGREFDVTIVLVTGLPSIQAVTSKKEAWVTVLSRARKCCVMVVDEKAEKDVPLVKQILYHVPERAVFAAKAFIGKFC